MLRGQRKTWAQSQGLEPGPKAKAEHRPKVRPEATPSHKPSPKTLPKPSPKPSLKQKLFAHAFVQVVVQANRLSFRVHRFQSLRLASHSGLLRCNADDAVVGIQGASALARLSLGGWC